MSERRLELCLRALWGRPFQVRFAELERSRFSASSMLVPLSARAGWSELDLARAAHASLHAVFSPLPFEPGKLRPVQRALLGILEDARVETLALSRFPGLRQTWAPFHEAGPGDGDSAPALLGRLARALFDSSYRDPSPWVQRAVEAFLALDLTKEGSLRELASVLGNELGQMRLPFDAAAASFEPRYRDDHAGLWPAEPQPARASNSGSEGALLGVARGASSQAGDETSEHPVTHRYPEWDYVIGRERADHCAVREQTRALGGAVAVPAPLLNRTRAALRRAHEAPRPRRRCADGRELDLAAVVAEATQRARGEGGDHRLYLGRRRRRIRTSALLLLDLSASLEGSDFSLLQSIAATLAASVPASAELAIDGFCSRGRDDVRYDRFKPFGARTPPLAAERSVAGSTRLGPALRHATQRLGERPSARKLLLLLSDAEPADVDVFDDRYLVEDARRACLLARGRGVRVVAWCLRPGLGAAQRRIFQGAHAVSLQRIEALPRHAVNAYSLRRSASKR
ncbi:MAG: hypothetical protein EOO73_01860 [Myxococcales bacterium]|nr:MAG: hypothetical protein EOO73_01860 [Myxococcales bacterium]